MSEFEKERKIRLTLAVPGGVDGTATTLTVTRVFVCQVMLDRYYSSAIS